MRLSSSPRLAANLAALALAGLLDACDIFGPSTRLLVQLPDPPPAWRAAFPEFGAALEYPAASGAGALRLAKWEEAAVIECDKAANGPFLAWPTIGGQDEGLLRPAGGLFPADLAADEAGEGGCRVLRLSWQDGPLALLVRQLMRSAMDVSGVNTGRLRACLAVAPDPWTWDIAAIATHLSAGTFTAWDIDPLPSADVQIATGHGEWFSESPFAAIAATGPDGSLSLPGMPFGMHTLFSTDGRRLQVWLDAKGVVTMP